MMPDNELLRIVGPDVKVMVWASNDELDEQTQYFQTMNYLLDGLVKKHLEEKTTWNQITFVHQLFGDSFWVAFVNIRKIAKVDFINSLKNIVPQDKREKLIVLNQTLLPTDWEQSLDKLFRFVEKI
jgi:hypothetical protein